MSQIDYDDDDAKWFHVIGQKGKIGGACEIEIAYTCSIKWY